MLRPRRRDTRRAQATPLFMLAQKAGLGAEAMGIVVACASVNGPFDGDKRILDWRRAHDELQELLYERNVLKPDSYISH